MSIYFCPQQTRHDGAQENIYRHDSVRNLNIYGRILAQFTGLLRTNTVAAKRDLLAERTGLGKSVSVSLRKNGPKGGPEPLEKEIHEILGSKREDRFSSPFFELVQKACQVHFSYLLRLGNFCKGPRTLRKFSQKCQKIAGC